MHRRLPSVLARLTPVPVDLTLVDEHWYGTRSIQIDGRETSVPLFLWRQLHPGIDRASRWCDDPGCVNPAHHVPSPRPAGLPDWIPPAATRSRARGVKHQWNFKTRMPVILSHIDRPLTIADINNFVPEDEHWMWTGSHRKARVRHRGPRLDKRASAHTEFEPPEMIFRKEGKHINVRRFLWTMVLAEELEPDVKVRNTCGKAFCVNPAHQRLVAIYNKRTDEQAELPDEYLKLVEKHPWIDPTL